MSVIATSLAVLFIKGIPEGLLTILALHLFTNTKIESKKFVLLSLVYIITTYLIRFLPITLGVNTILSFLSLIIFFQFFYKAQSPKLVGTVISIVVIVVLIALSEILNMLLLVLMFGEAKADELFKSSVGITQSLSTIPSTVFLAVLIYIGHHIMKYLNSRKQQHGEAGQGTGK